MSLPSAGFSNGVVYGANIDLRGTGPNGVVGQYTTNGQLMFGSTGLSPAVALPSVSNGLTYTGSAGGGTWGLNASSIDNGTLTVAHGGTGDSSIAAYSVMCGGTTTTNPLQVVASLGSAGQVLTSNGAAALPSWQNATMLEWVEISADQSAANNTGYYVNGAGLVTLTLPVTAAKFTAISVMGNSLATSWKIAQGGGQQIFFASQSTTSDATGFLASNGAFQVVTIVCTVANNTWVVHNSVGNITVA